MTAQLWRIDIMKTRKTLTERVGNILDAFETENDSMSLGDRISLMEMSINVGRTVGAEPKSVLPFVDWFAHNNEPEGYVSRGKFGGYIRGEKPVKGTRKVNSTSSTETDTSDSQ
jgi:hypothetical protein